MARATRREESTSDAQITVRVSRGLHAALRAEVRAEQTRRPGERVVLADVVRRILARALLPAPVDT